MQAAEYLPKIAPSPHTDAIVETSKVAAVEPIGRPAEMVKGERVFCDFFASAPL